MKMRSVMKVEMRRWILAVLIGGTGGALAAAPPAAEKLDPDQLAFFEKKIRPVLNDHCYKCHSATAEKLKGGLFVDSKEGLLKGGETGPAVVPGNVAKSLLLKSIKSDDKETAMPPKGPKLPDSVIADFELWVRSGAPDPRVNVAGAKSMQAIDPEKARKHWAFQPVKKLATPAVSDSKGWAKTDLDRFVLAKLQAKGLEPSPIADKRTLIRRATFDLIGLPPTPEEVAAFVADNSPNAFRKVIDRLLESPAYGERWGRHWLDVARYADTSGDRNNNPKNPASYAYAWTYRDYVIQAFNQDKPFNQFVMEQIAADRLPIGQDRSSLAALGFLTVGKRFMGNINEVIDDRIDVVTQGLLGMTAACARCHDHKFDPVSQRDYYGLHGVFNSSVEPVEEPIISFRKSREEYEEYMKQVAAIEERITGLREIEENKVLSQFRGSTEKYLTAARNVVKAGGKNAAKIGRENGLDPDIFEHWVDLLKKASATHDPVFAAWVAFSAIADDRFATEAKALAAKLAANADATRPVNDLVARSFATAPAKFADVAQAYARLFKETEKQFEKAGKDGKLDPAHAQLATVLHGADSPIKLDRRGFQRVIGNKIQNQEAAEAAKIVELNMSHPGSPIRAMVLTDKDRPVDSFIMIRGEPANKGPVVPRKFIDILAGPKPEPFKNGSGRYDLAMAVASKDNPLTARVFVNRAWLWHFGDALVRTPGDFGLRSEAPANPELLDHLAWKFMEDGWSVKQLHRTILLSSTWQQTSLNDERNSAIDPGNSLFWRQNLQRLDFESLRDSLLVLSAKQEFTKRGGPPVNLALSSAASRRTVYGMVDRVKMPDAYRIFDFANPDMTSPMRMPTTVPLQALYMMNNAFVIEQARGMIERDDFKARTTDEQRVDHLYQLAYQRLPTSDERHLALEFLHEQSSASEPSSAPASDSQVWQYGTGNYDPAAKAIKGFKPLPVFSGTAWQLTGKLPNPKLGGAVLTADGGQPGDAAQDVVRRWIAPVDGTVSIDAILSHSTKRGDGVMGIIISSRNGELGRWKVFNTSQPTRFDKVVMRKGDTLDFVTDSLQEPSFDTFTWAPVIRLVDAQGQEWNAMTQFAGPAGGKGAVRAVKAKSLTAWEKFAQVLLEANELIFVN